MTQGKTNADIAIILGISESTAKKHLLEIFEKLGVPPLYSTNSSPMQCSAEQRLDNVLLDQAV